jgi:crotonobetainyl-CoA:carnitine CoA-transferase CaiB-like acyl-CoA transferase
MVTFSRTPGRYGPGALAGEHTDALLDELGYDAAAMVELREQRVVASEPVYDPATYRPPGL